MPYAIPCLLSTSRSPERWKNAPLSLTPMPPPPTHTRSRPPHGCFSSNSQQPTFNIQRPGTGLPVGRWMLDVRRSVSLTFSRVSFSPIPFSSDRGARLRGRFVFAPGRQGSLESEPARHARSLPKAGRKVGPASPKPRPGAGVRGTPRYWRKHNHERRRHTLDRRYGLIE